MSEQVRDLFADGSVTVPGLASEFGISRSIAYELMKAGKLPFTHLGTKRLIPRRAIVQLLAAGLSQGTKPEALANASA